MFYVSRIVCNHFCYFSCSSSVLFPDVYSKTDTPVNTSTASVLRSRYAMALKATARLSDAGKITPTEKGVLKELILDHDKRIFAAIEVFEIDQDASEMLDTMYRIAKRAMMDQ